MTIDQLIECLTRAREMRGGGAEIILEKWCVYDTSGPEITGLKVLRNTVEIINGKEPGIRPFSVTVPGEYGLKWVSATNLKSALDRAKSYFGDSATVKDTNPNIEIITPSPQTDRSSDPPS